MRTKVYFLLFIVLPICVLFAQEPDEYLIITRTMFLEELQPLVNEKTNLGLSVRTYTLSEIDIQFNGNDIQEKLRNCIKNRYWNNNLKWVLLVGCPDADDNPASSSVLSPTQLDKEWEMPVRYVYCPTDNYTFIPCEMYYSALDGTWDDDQDGVYGEKTSDCSAGLDEIDWIPEIALGRIPAKTESQAEIYISKLLNNEYASYPREDLNCLQINCLVEDHLADGYVSGKVLAETLGYDPPTSENIDKELNTHDYPLLTFTGHGNTTSWATTDGSWTGDGLTATQYDVSQNQANYYKMVNSQRSQAQSFIPNSSLLLGIELYIWNFREGLGPLNISIREQLDGNDLVSSTLSAAEAKLEFNYIQMDTLEVTPGNTYYLVLESPESTVLGEFWSVGRIEDNYGDGVSYSKNTSQGQDWTADEYDLTFRTLTESIQNKASFVFSAACLTSYVDASNENTTITENLLFKESCGAIGYIGAWRISTPAMQTQLWDEFFRMFFDGGNTIIGQTLMKSQKSFYYRYAYWHHYWYDYYRYTQVLYSLFGDPHKRIGIIENNGPEILSMPSSLASTANFYHYDEDYTADALVTGNPTWTKQEGPDPFNISGQGYIDWIPPENDRTEITIRATDLNGSTDQKFVVQPCPAYNYGEITSMPNQIAIVDAAYSYDDNNTAEVSNWIHSKWKILKAPDGFSINRETGEVSWIPHTPGEYEIIIQAISDSLYFDSQRFTVNVDVGSLTEKNTKSQYPEHYNMEQNYPNPFNPSTTIKFYLPKSGFVELNVYNMLGKEVANLVSAKLQKGYHRYTFDGRQLASGVYYYQLVAGRDPSTGLSRADSRGSGQQYREVKKMLLVK